MVTSIYVLADTIIIGKGIGTDAMAALNIALPVYNLFFGTGLLFGVGGSVMMSICRGHGEHSKGNAYFSLSFLLNVLACIIYMIICNTFAKEIALFLGATDVTLPYVMDYLPYITWSLPVFAFSSFLQTFIRNDGAPKLAMTAVVSGGIFNVIFDYILVYPCQMGMAGAAIATVCGSILTVLILLIHFFGKHNHLHFCFSEIRSSFGSDIFKSGFASFLIDLSSGIVIFFFNQQLLRYQGDLGVSVYGIISNTAIVVTCLSNGICQAAQPIISTNFGAGFQERIDHVRKLGLRTALFICAIPTLLGLPESRFTSTCSGAGCCSPLLYRIFDHWSEHVPHRLLPVNDKTGLCSHTLPDAWMCIKYYFCENSTDLFRSERNLDFCPACRTIHITYWNPAVEKIDG